MASVNSMPNLSSFIHSTATAQCSTAFITTAKDLYSQCNLGPLFDEYVSGMNMASKSNSNSFSTAKFSANITAVLKSTVLQKACKKTCTKAVDMLTPKLTAACGDKPVLSGTTYGGMPINAVAISSYVSLISKIACVRSPKDRSYCAPQIVAPLIGASPPRGPNVSPIDAYLAAYCTDCINTEISTALGETKFIDYPSMSAALIAEKNILTKHCPKKGSPEEARLAAAFSSRPARSASTSFSTSGRRYNSTTASQNSTLFSQLPISHNGPVSRTPFIIALTTALGTAVVIYNFFLNKLE